MPNESLIYLADNQFAPYGRLSEQEIINRVNTIADWFVKQNVKALVLACNTATVNAIDQLRRRVSIPIIGVEPAIKPAVKHSKTQHVAILVTQATSTNQRFLSLIKQHQHNAKVHIIACPGLVEIVEQDKVGSNECHRLLQQYLAPIEQYDVDTIVLGCTHYPFLKHEIIKRIGENIELVETATPVAKQLARQLIDHKIATVTASTGRISFYATNTNIAQEKIFSHLWQNKITLKDATI